MPDLTTVAGRRGRAYDALLAHRWWGYRACAPAPGDPAVCAADEATPVTAWETPDVETQPERAAREAVAVALCGGCPLREACAGYALGTPQDGLYERDGVWGGLTPTRRRQMARDRLNTTLPAVDPPTAQWGAVLAALAAHTGPEEVAAAAGVDVRTANWQRSKAVTALRLDPRTATRMQLLTTAWHLGWLPQNVAIVPDGPVPVAAIPGMQHHVTPPGRRLSGTAADAQMLFDLDWGSHAGRSHDGLGAGVRPVRRGRHLRLLPAIEPLPLDLPGTPAGRGVLVAAS